jgi:hypothetical protein
MADTSQDHVMFSRERGVEVGCFIFACNKEVIWSCMGYVVENKNGIWSILTSLILVIKMAVVKFESDRYGIRKIVFFLQIWHVIFRSSIGRHDGRLFQFCM